MFVALRPEFPYAKRIEHVEAAAERDAVSITVGPSTVEAEQVASESSNDGGVGPFTVEQLVAGDLRLDGLLAEAERVYGPRSTREVELERQYEMAIAEWIDAGDAAAWDVTAGDGLDVD
jgi:hypothetical protein